MKTGLDLLDKCWPKKLKGSRIGLLIHPASVNKDLENAETIVLRSDKVELRKLFGPQHGIRGETQDNMVEWKGFKDKGTDLRVYSLYSSSRKPSQHMLEGIDVLVIDLQDIGSRYYTFIWTMDLCMQACSEAGKTVVVLDRPNPLGGVLTEGPVLDENFASFVGLRPLPVRHGMTIGEIGWYLKNEFYPDLDFHLIRMREWKRTSWFDQTGLPWVMPSPNMPTLDTAAVYPGMCLVEGTNLSEGRGTTRPFELCGAPFVKPDELVNRLTDLRLPGVAFRPIHFQPTFQKYAGRLCGGLQLHVKNRSVFKPFKTAVSLIKTVHDLYPEFFQWKKPPYEYERHKLPIDILCGTDRIRKGIEQGDSADAMEAWWSEELRLFQRAIRKKYLIYEK